MVVKNEREGKKIMLIDRSGAEVDDDCGMAFFWNRIWHPEGRPEVAGIVPEVEASYLRIGRETHEDLAMIAEMEDLSSGALTERVNELLAPVEDVDRLDTELMEVLYRRIGWFVAQGLFIEPRTRETYDTVFVEDEIILDREPLWVPVTPDRVLRHKTTHRLHYREYKSTAITSAKWSGQWPFAIQLHIGLAALNEELKEKVEFAQIMGLAKGYAGMRGLSHPYVYGYHNGNTGEWSPEYQSGTNWTRKGIWEYPAGPVDWVQKCGVEVANAQFPMSPPVMLDEAMLANWVTRQKARRKEVTFLGETCVHDLKMRAMVFPQHTKRCRPPYGDQCAYLPLCWNATNASNPLRGGAFVPRVPHHEVEILWREDERRGGAH